LFEEGKRKEKAKGKGTEKDERVLVCIIEDFCFASAMY